MATDTLSEVQEMFVQAFVHEAGLDKNKAKAIVERLRGGATLNATNMMAVPKVMKAIHTEVAKSTTWINQNIILNRLYHEGITSSNPTSRVNALVWVGKQLGMWKETEAGRDVVFQVVNYAGSGEKQDEKVVEQLTTAEVSAAIPPGISITSYYPTESTN